MPPGSPAPTPPRPTVRQAKDSIRLSAPVFSVAVAGQYLWTALPLQVNFKLNCLDDCNKTGAVGNPLGHTPQKLEASKPTVAMAIRRRRC